MWTAWAFAGGVVPAHPPVLPPEAYPTTSPSPGASPSGAIAMPSATTATTSPSASAVPLPTGAPSPPNSSTGDQAPLIPTTIAPFAHRLATVDTSPIGAILGICFTQPVPSGCPPSLTGVYQGGVVGPPPAPTALPPVALIYASIPQPGQAQVVFTALGSGASFGFWSGSGGAVQSPSSLEAAVLGGKQVWIAAFAVQAGQSVNFMAATSGPGVRGVSGLGTISVGG
ncbi:MAG: hypothetical protein ACYDAK_12405 [Candidatus Limnocylindrales bacterium]